MASVSHRLVLEKGDTGYFDNARASPICPFYRPDRNKAIQRHGELKITVVEALRFSLAQDWPTVPNSTDFIAGAMPGLLSDSIFRI
jgi:hypothetical protein